MRLRFTAIATLDRDMTVIWKVQQERYDMCFQRIVYCPSITHIPLGILEAINSQWSIATDEKEKQGTPPMPLFHFRGVQYGLVRLYMFQLIVEIIAGSSHRLLPEPDHSYATNNNYGLLERVEYVQCTCNVCEPCH